MSVRGKKFVTLDPGAFLEQLNQEFDNIYRGLDGGNVKLDSLTTGHLKRTQFNVTVGMDEVGALHNLGQVPADIIIIMTSTGNVWQTREADKFKVYLQADNDGRTCKVTCIA